MGKRTGSPYTKMPEVPEDVAKRLESVTRVMADRSSITAEAKSLGISRVAMQTLVHRAVQGMIAGVTPRRPGPIPTPESEAALREENERLRRDLRTAQTKSEMAERFLSVAGDLIRGRSGPSRSPATSPSKTTTTTESEDDGDGERRVRLAAAVVLLGEVPLPVIASTVGTSTSSLFRWRRRARIGEPLAGPRGGGAPAAPCVAQRARVEALVRSSHGIVGADALRVAVPGVSRRAALRIKRATCTAMERERVEASGRVEVTMPGVVRGFDAMHLAAAEGKRYALIAADGAIPFRTSALLVEHYDEANVLRALERDFAANGPPLVLRMDRASCQSTPRVRQMLASSHVLLLRGPAHHPGYYGQHERQHRDHRAWLDAMGATTSAELDGALDEMLNVMNEDLPRRALGWNTPRVLWTRRPVLADNREELEQEVQDRMTRIAEDLRRTGVGEKAAADRAERYAVESALVRRGYLRIG